MATTDPSNLRKTPLFDAHVELGGKLVDFGGFAMPVQYADGILAEHRAVRGDVGIFDVSHMGEADFEGETAFETVQHLVTNDVGRLTDGRALYTMVCNERGGIVDDCIVYRFAPDHFRIVINAANIEKDLAHFRAHLRPGTELVDRSSDLALIAVQGPRAVALVSELAGHDMNEVPSFGMGEAVVAGKAVVAARTGYTGEDGFELFVPAEDARAVWDALVAAGAKPAGLGARDTLRLEARLCLYGNDIDETTTPYEAGLGWTVKLDKPGGFVGRDALAAQKAKGIERKLVGFVVEGRGIVRAGAEVLDAEGQPVGRVTSGGVAPTVGGAIGMAYVPLAMAAPDTQLTVAQRGRTHTARVVKGPFYRRPS
ncbi:MAG: glycine cleavage system aminomethyltransferase GcvT [Deltaproteobacteria bacterium]|nr:MAG: glycine cleavage system aminomethyltransferase GcvT [Deltaproteobacteria bacterium]